VTILERKPGTEKLLKWVLMARRTLLERTLFRILDRPGQSDDQLSS